VSVAWSTFPNKFACCRNVSPPIYTCCSRLVVIRGGEKIHPVEVENCLFKMEGIQNVSIVGVPDTRFGEQVCAWVSTKSGHQVSLEDIQGFCKGKIAHYKVPRYLIVVDHTEFPLTPSGKIQKNILRERAKTMLRLE